MKNWRYAAAVVCGALLLWTADSVAQQPEFLELKAAIVAIEDGVLLVQPLGAKETVTYKILPATMLVIGSKPAALAQFQAGDHVVVYSDRDQPLTAREVVRIEAPPAPNGLEVPLAAPVLEGVAGSLGIRVAPSPRGLLVADVNPSGAAAKMKLQPGDYILELDGIDPKSPAAFLTALGAKNVGDTVKLRIWSAGEEQTLAVVLAAQGPPVASKTVVLEGPVLPAYLQGITWTVVNEGIAVAAVEAGSPGAKLPLRQGDVVLSVGDRTVRTEAELHGVFGGLRSGTQVDVVVLRGGLQERVVFTIPAVAAAPPIQRVRPVLAEAPDYVRALLENQELQANQLQQLFRELQTLRAEVNALKAP